MNTLSYSYCRRPLCLLSLLLGLFLGSTSLQAQAPFGGYLSMYKNAYVDRDISVGNGIFQWPNNESLTFEFWVRVCPLPGFNSALRFGANPPGFTDLNILCQQNCSYVCNSPTICRAACSASNLNMGDGNWHHVALIYDRFGGGSARIATFYIDGQQAWTSYAHLYTSSNDFGYNGNQLRIGSTNCTSTSTAARINLQIDEIRISEGILYTGTSFTVPTGPFVADTNTLVLYHFDEGQDSTYFYDSSGGDNHLEACNGAHTNAPIGLFDAQGAQDSVSICTGDTLFAEGGSVFDWTPGYAFSDSTTRAPMVTLADTSFWAYVAVSDSNLCAAPLDSIFVTVYALPIANAGSDTTLCLGDSISIGSPALPDLTYLWAPASGLASATDAISLASPFQSTLYQLQVTDTLTGCVNLDSVSLTVSAPMALIQADTQIICWGDTIQLTVGQNNNYGVSWTPANLMTMPTQATTAFVPPADTNVVLTITNSLGCVDSDTLAVTVHPLPILTTTADTAICFGDSASLSANGGQSYQWSPGIGLSHPNAAATMSSPPTSQVYHLAVTDSNACFAMDSVKISVYALPGLTLPADTAICAGDSVVILAQSTSPNPVSWTPVLGLNDPSLLQPTASPAQTTSYSLTITDTTGCISVDAITIMVDSLPNLSIIADTFLCWGDSLSLWAQGASQYTWSPAALLTDPNSDQPTAFPVTNTLFHVLASNANGCVTMDSVMLSVSDPSSAILLADTLICLGDSLLLYSRSDGLIYEWSPGTLLSDSTLSQPWATPTQNTWFTLQFMDSLGCQSLDSVEVQVSSDTLVSGIVYQSNGLPLTQTVLLVVEYSPADSTIMAVDTVLTDSVGAYLLSLNQGIYYLKAIPDSAVYPLELPTYYAASTTVQMADTLPLVCDTTQLTFATIAGQNPGGTGFIAGNIYQGAGKSGGVALPELGLFLYRNGQALMHRETNVDGYFRFNSLPAGTYELWVDYPFIDNMLAPEIQLTAGRMMQDSLTFELEATRLVQLSNLPISTPLTSNFVLFPNPSSGWVQGRFEQPLQEAASLELMDLYGRTIQTIPLTAGSWEFKLDLSGLSAGVYLCRIQGVGWTKLQYQP